LYRQQRPAKAVKVFAGRIHVELLRFLHHFVALDTRRSFCTCKLSLSDTNQHISPVSELNTQDHLVGQHVLKVVFSHIRAPILPHCRAPPFLTFAHTKCSETEEWKLNKRYFRKKDPMCKTEDIEWIEMSGKEFYRFVNSPEGQGRHFIDMGNVVLESTQSEAKVHKSEKDHSNYLKEQEGKWEIFSLYCFEIKNGRNGEAVVMDDSEDVEAEAIMRTELDTLRKALALLDRDNFRLIYDLYLADERKTLRQLSQETSIPVMTLQNRKAKILSTLREYLDRKNF